MEAMELDSIVECYTETDMEFQHDDVSDFGSSSGDRLYGGRVWKD